MTIGDLKDISKLLKGDCSTKTLDCQLGEKVIIRTYSAGVWYGTLSEKSGNEVILTKARRMHYWKSKKTISLSGVSVYGIDDTSKICPRVSKLWLESIEILSLTDVCIKSIEDMKDVEAM